MARPSEIVIANDQVYHLGLRKGQLAKNVFVVGDPARAVRVSKQFDTIDHEVSKREFITITGSYKGLPVSVIGTGIGTDNVEIALVEAFIAHEFDFSTGERLPGMKPMTFIRLGTSGGVQQDIEPGAFAIASYALGLDSTGLYYDEPPEDDVTQRIENAATDILEAAAAEGSRFKGKLIPYASKATSSVAKILAIQSAQRNVKFEVGITAASPGFYGPSSRYIDGLKNTIPDIKGELARLNIDGLRIINMEMESSLLFHLCRQLGYRVGTICPVISAPTKSDKVVDYDALVGTAISIGLDAMLELSCDPS